MTLIRSISGIRGTIGGEPGDNLTPLDVSRYALAFGTYVKRRGGKSVVVGRDARPSGEMVHHLVIGNLLGIGLDVIDLGMATTPTVEMAVTGEKAGAGLILTASHNPRNWNALKLLDDQGEFFSAEAGQEVLEIAEAGEYTFVEVNKLGRYRQLGDYLDRHIEAILAHDLVDREAVSKAGFKIVVDGINSVGGVAVPRLLRALGVEQIVELYCRPDGDFAHNPEPLPDHLSSLCSEVKMTRADLGIAVDPDVDRLALIDEKGEPIGEEYTLVSVADYFLQYRPGATVSNLSSSRALRDVTEKYGGTYHASPVGERHVVEKMKAVQAVIGGEGNGGVIVPDLHYGRDALAGIALILSYLARSGKALSVVRASLPNYHIDKDKVALPAESQFDMDEVLSRVSAKYESREQNHEDGLKIFFDEDWVHLRKSNTEPIIRIYAESSMEQTAKSIARKIRADITEIIKSAGKA